MNIYVANLDYSVNAQNLRELFAAYGEVDSAKVIMDRETGRKVLEQVAGAPVSSNTGSSPEREVSPQRKP